MPTLRLALFGDAVILVNGHPLTSDATHLFALLLLLAVEGNRRLTRQELQALLFDNSSPRQASHNLRQLLYRLRRMGLAFAEGPAGIRLADAVIVHPAARFHASSPSDVQAITLTDLSFLPSYNPPLPSVFLQWLAGVRDSSESQLHKALLGRLLSLRQSQSWPTALHLAQMLLVFDPFNELLIATIAESLAVLGKRQAALIVLDQHIRDTSDNQSPSHDLRALRFRITKLPDMQRGAGLYGRESSLCFLQSQWQQLDATGARQITLIGRPGLGKTRLANAFSTQLSLGGAHVVTYECDLYSRSQPLALFSHILPKLRTMRGSLGASPLHIDTLARICCFDPAATSSTRQDYAFGAFRDQAYAAVADLLESVSAERRLLLIVDDAHFLDDASRTILGALASTANSAAVVILLCSRYSPHGSSPSLHGKRASVLEIEPLSPDASRTLLEELLSAQVPTDGHLSWCLEHAAGNPFYLHTLAAHSSHPQTSAPFNLRSLASKAYYALQPLTRSILDACLLLGRLATIARVQSLADACDRDMMGALRELEENDLVHFADGVLCGPHAILHDILRDLIPSSLRGLLHQRLARMLHTECITEGYSPSTALMAARSWIIAGDPKAATRLLRQCARHAASLGEPSMAAALLSQVLDLALPSSLKASILDDLVGYAQSAGSQEQAALRLRERYQIAHDLRESTNALKDLELRIIEADLLNGGQLRSAIAPLIGILEDPAVHTPVRLRAAVRLIIIADLELDVDLACLAHQWVVRLRKPRREPDPLFRHAELVYHTSFGDIATAERLADQLVASFPAPSMSEDAIKARNFAAYAFYRLRSWDKAISLCEDSYSFMTHHKAANHAIYQASLLAEMAVTDGRFSEASVWLDRVSVAAGGTAPHRISPSSGLYCSAGVIAMMEGRYDEAEQLVTAPGRSFPTLAAARNRAVLLAICVRIRQLRGDNVPNDPDLVSLEALYERGRALGGQDAIVEALWCARIEAGKPSDASFLLRDYLTIFRREVSKPDWALRFVTSADDAWQTVSVRSTKYECQ